MKFKLSRVSADKHNSARELLPFQQFKTIDGLNVVYMSNLLDT